MPIPSPSDASLLRAIVDGDRAALGALYDRYANLLMAVGVRRLGDRRDAEEVLHEVFVEAWRCAPEYDPARGSVRAWLVTRMHSRSLDRLRTGGHRRTDPYDAERAARIATTDDPAVAVDRARVAAALELLPPEQRAVIELAYVSGLSSTEIAERLGIPVGTAKSRIALGLGRLRGTLLRGT